VGLLDLQIEIVRVRWRNGLNEIPEVQEYVLLYCCICLKNFEYNLHLACFEREKKGTLRI
jgi:hypothetical protein